MPLPQVIFRRRRKGYAKIYVMNVRINIDGGSRGNPGPGASAYVIKDLSGQILAQEGHFIPHCTNNQAEYTALKLALIKSAELNAQELEIISDSLLLVKQYLGEYKIKNPDLAARMQEIRRLAARFNKISIRHVLRHLNKEPDSLANKAMDMKQSVGYNPIQKMPSDEPAPAAKRTDDNTVNGVPVTPVIRPAATPAPAKPAAKKTAAKRADQPDLFGGF